MPVIVMVLFFYINKGDIADGQTVCLCVYIQCLHSSPSPALPFLSVCRCDIFAKVVAFEPFSRAISMGLA